MREVILSYWNSFFADFIRPYRDDITAISTLIVAIFTVVLARRGGRRPLKLKTTIAV